MRKLIAMAVLGAGAMLFSIAGPAQAMPTATGEGVAKLAAADNSVEQVGHRRHWKRWGYRRHHHRRFYGYYPYYYQPYYSYYPYPYYYRRHHHPRFGIYLRF